MDEMNTFAELLYTHAGLFFDHVSYYLTADGGIVPVMAAGVAGSATIPAGTLAAIRHWHGSSIEKKMDNINTLVDLIMAHQSPPGPQPDGATPKGVTTIWPMDGPLYNQLINNRNALQVLVNKCRSRDGSTNDRDHRNTLLKETIDLCLIQVKGWAYGLFSKGTMTANDLHDLGFLAPGEKGGSHERAEATDALAEVKVKVINEDFIHVVIDQSSDANAGPVLHGWPHGVKNALIVITADDGETEVLRKSTTHLHNDIEMPGGSHGKAFIIRAAFLRHPDDTPRFGNEPTFSMPLTTRDIVAKENHLQDKVGKQQEEIERLRRELEEKNKS